MVVTTITVAVTAIHLSAICKTYTNTHQISQVIRILLSSLMLSEEQQSAVHACLSNKNKLTNK
uniref:Uncharacterized protein n=1 Tax=Glossina brevipalpis TaxID=37001 RepID=A0A1A9WCG8_9MUSC